MKFTLIHIFLCCCLLNARPCVGQKSSVKISGGITFEDNGADTPYIIQSNGNADQTVKENIFIRVETSKKTVYEGEPLLVTYKLFTRLHSNSQVVTQPTFTGCSVIEMTTDDLLPQTEMLEGKWYKSYVIRKVQLLPLQTGTLLLGTATVNNTISFYTSNNDVAYHKASDVKNITLHNAETNIIVSPLPTIGKPIHFSGSVGSFDIKAHLAKRNDTANDINTLEITVTGKGNFRSLQCPKVAWPKEIDFFEEESEESIDRLSFPQTGTKVFKLPFTCRKQGKFTIPPIELAYFDGDTKQYILAKSDSIFITAAAEVKIDMTHLSGDITNKKYLFIIPLIAVVAALVWWYFFGNKNSVNNAIATTSFEKPTIEKPTIEIPPIEVAEKSVLQDDFLSELLLTEDVIAYYNLAKKIALMLAEKQINDTAKEDLMHLVAQCNEVLYGASNTITKEEVLKRLEHYC